jgi:hypothetical protein
MPKIDPILPSDRPDAAAPTNGQGMQLHRNQATVHTASLDVKIMRLDKKQVTLSVFRQIPEESILALNAFLDERDDIERYEPLLAGVPWGIVRYTWDKSPPWADYYLVWQRDEQLYRMPLPLVINLWRSFVCGKRTGLRCSSCGREYDPRYDNVTYRCGNCSRRLRPYKVDDYKSVCLAFCQHALDWNLDRDEICHGGSGQAILEQLRQFEKLDQLFVAV